MTRPLALPWRPTQLWRWLTTHDRGLLALRRAARSAIVMPAMFALGAKVIKNPEVATFAAFGSFAMLMLVDFGGAMKDRLRAQASLAVVGAAFVCVATLASQNHWLAAVAMGVVGFGVLFIGVVSSVLAGATTSLLLAFILPVSLAAPPSQIPDRLAGWGLASAAALVAIAVMWPAPAYDPLREKAAVTCRALAARMRSEVAYMLAAKKGKQYAEHTDAIIAADQAVNELHRLFLATPYRPTGLSTSARAVIRLIDELNWLSVILLQVRKPSRDRPVNKAACRVKKAAAVVLEQGADLLEHPHDSSEALESALAELHAALETLEHSASGDLPQLPSGAEPGADTTPAIISGGNSNTDNLDAVPDAAAILADEHVSEVIDALDPSFRAQELAFMVSLIGRNIDEAARAERRSWFGRLLGRRPAPSLPGAALPGTLSAVQERAAAHVEPHSVWLHNSVRGAVGLALAVLVAELSGVQHSFWVVLGTLSVLRSNALNTGQNAVRAVLGTSVGFVIGAALLVPIGSDTDLLWFLLPLAILIAGVAPATISFAAGQAGFTVVLVILFNIIQPIGWRVGLLRIEDIAIGCAVSFAVGLLFWPRGAAAALSKALAEAYTDSARYLAAAVEFGVFQCDSTAPKNAESNGAPTASKGTMNGSGTTGRSPAPQAIRAAAAARRMDDTFRSYLAERGQKALPLAEVTRLVTGVAGLRLAADAVIDLWDREDEHPRDDRSAARLELIRHMETVRDWYDDLAESLDGQTPVPAPLDRDEDADGRLVRAVQRDLRDEDGQATATAVRMIWTGDHLDAVRRLQRVLVQPAVLATDHAAGRTPNGVTSHRLAAATVTD
jgi:uncharacterized membrane protein YccC